MLILLLFGACGDSPGDDVAADAPPVTTAPAPTTTTTLAVTTTTTTAPPTTTTTARPRPTTTTSEAPAPVASGCHPSYTGTCIPADVSDADCAGGSGNGPYYVREKDVGVVGPDEYDLDRDNDGVGCES